MMKIVGLTLGITILLAGLLAGMAVAETVTFDVYQGWTLLAVPQVPFEPAVPDVFGSIPTIDKLSTFVSGADFSYNDDTKDFFGGMMLGQGYWLWLDAASATVSYAGVPDGVPDLDGGGVPIAGTKTDMWISLPGVDQDGDGVNESGAWHMIGNPYNHYVDFGAGGVNVKFTDGNTVKTWAEASAEPGAWVAPVMTGFQGGADLSSSYLGFDEGYVPFMMPAAGYWIFTYQPSLAMIIDGNAEYAF